MITFADAIRVYSMIGQESGRVYLGAEDSSPEGKQERNREIAERHAAHESLNDLAHDYGLTTSRIWQICRERRG